MTINPTLDRFILHIEIIKGTLFMGIVGLLWFQPDKEMARRRETLITMIIAVPASLVVNRVLSTLLPFRNRPMYSIGAAFLATMRLTFLRLPQVCG